MKEGPSPAPLSSAPMRPQDQDQPDEQQQQQDALAKGVAYEVQPPAVAVWEEDTCSFWVFLLLLAFQGMVAFLLLRHFGFITFI
jgi:hypothetical protein